MLGRPSTDLDIVRFKKGETADEEILSQRWMKKPRS
jgi:hypothetical protein